MSRMPQIGDLIITKPDQKRYSNSYGFVPEKSYSGVIYEIKKDSYGSPFRVFLMWSEGPPPNYHPEAGFNGTNIHNLRHEFKVVRKGVEIK